MRKEIEYFYGHEELETLYIGGGTPSVLSVNEIAEIIGSFKFAKGAEITEELNPETLTAEYFTGICEAGVNRISLGCQTFDDELLKLIGRRHNSYQVKHAVKLAKDAGFENVSLDFIYGLPTQSIEGFEKDLLTAVGLGVKHISLYGLKIDEGCYFYANPPENLPDDDVQADMYLKAVEVLCANNFEHYEISNFSKHGYESRHNLNYWNNNSYYGFGIAAHGYVDGERYSNYTDFETYFKSPQVHEIIHRVSREEKLEEEIFLGFRRMSGINVSEINKKFAIDFEEKYKKILKKYLETGHLRKTENGYALTLNGVMVSNIILAEFI